jgi:hypothetical protein
MSRSNVEPEKTCFRRREELKVFCFFSSEKKESSFFEKKEAKKLLFLRMLYMIGHCRNGRAGA